MSVTRVLVIEDSATVRALLVDVISSNPEFEVVGEAEDGRKGAELCERLRPDVITLDMMLPLMTGVEATEYIMAHCPTPILIVSSSFNRGEVFNTYDALAAGAVDVLEKPTGKESPGQWERGFLRALRIVSRVKVITHPRGRHRSWRSENLVDSPAPVSPASGGLGTRMLAIGVSTGGPHALVEILGHLPRHFPFPILIVLHISESFASYFPDWLSQQTGHQVAYAQDGDWLSTLSPSVRLAPPDKHLVVQSGRTRLIDSPPRHSCRPSVDVLFESLATSMAPRVVACLLTGMGRDGAQGLLELRKGGARTLAQDEASSVVYGMPREAALLGAASQILALTEIAPRLTAIFGAEVSP